MLPLDLFVLAAYTLLGYVVGWALLSESDHLLTAAVSLPLGGGILTFVVFLVSWLGAPLTSIMVGGCWLGLLALALLFWRISGTQKDSDQRGTANMGAPELVMALALVGVVGSAAVVAIGRSYSAFDAAVGWSLKGYGMFLDRSVHGAADWGSWGKAYPLNLPLQIGIFYGASSDALTLSKLLFPLYLLSLLLMCVWFWIRNGISLWIALAGVLFLATIRLVYYQATIGYANLPFAAYFVGGTLLALEGLFEDRSDLRTVAGVLLALGAWTRAEGIGYVLLIVVIFAVVWAKRHGRWRPPLRWAIPTAVVFIPWYLFARSGIEQSHLGTATRGVLPSMLDGQFNLFQLYLVPRLFLERALSPTNMGVFIQMTAALFAIGALRIRQWLSHKAIGLLLASAATAAVPMLLFYVRSFTRLEEFRELLIRSFDRAFLPATFMLVLSAVYLAAGRAEPAAQELGSPAGGRVK